MKFTTTLLIGLFFALSQIGEAQDTPSVVDSEVTSVNELVFTEGPAYHRDGSVFYTCLLYTSPSPRDPKTSRMPSSA